MNELLEAIRLGVAEDASEEARAAGAAACRTVLVALDPHPRASLGEPVPVIAPLAAAVAALRGVPPDRLLDLAIERLKAALPAGATVATPPRLDFQLVPIRSESGRDR